MMVKRDRDRDCERECIINGLTNIEVKSIDVVECYSDQYHSYSTSQGIDGIMAVISVADQCLIDVKSKKHDSHWGCGQIRG